MIKQWLRQYEEEARYYAQCNIVYTFKVGLEYPRQPTPMTDPFSVGPSLQLYSDKCTIQKRLIFSLIPSAYTPRAPSSSHIVFLLSTPFRSTPSKSLSTALTGHTNPSSSFPDLPSSIVTRYSTNAIPTYAPIAVKMCHHPCNSNRNPQGSPT